MPIFVVARLPKRRDSAGDYCIRDCRNPDANYYTDDWQDAVYTLRYLCEQVGWEILSDGRRGFKAISRVCLSCSSVCGLN